MTRVTGVDRRYARALLKLGESDLAKCRQQHESLHPVKQLFEIEQAQKVLKSPVMPLDLKLELLDYALGLSTADETLKKFVRYIAQSGRIVSLPGIIEAYGLLLDEQEGLVHAELTTAVKMDPAKVKELFDDLGADKKINVEYEIDPEILGGMIVKMGNQLIDMSLRTKLNQFAKDAIG